MAFVSVVGDMVTSRGAKGLNRMESKLGSAGRDEALEI
jgi:hypothetical protein